MVVLFESYRANKQTNKHTSVADHTAWTTEWSVTREGFFAVCCVRLSDNKQHSPTHHDVEFAWSMTFPTLSRQSVVHGLSWSGDSVPEVRPSRRRRRPVAPGWHRSFARLSPLSTTDRREICKTRLPNPITQTHTFTIHNMCTVTDGKPDIAPRLPTALHLRQRLYAL